MLKGSIPIATIVTTGGFAKMEMSDDSGKKTDFS
jgi:hypothetical protein